MKFLIAISSYLKNIALKELLETLINHQYHLAADILITDDSEDKTALEVYKEFKPLIPSLKYIGGGANIGISGNKNRGIKYFLDNKEYENILMLDDDMLFVSSGLLEHLDMVCKTDNLPLITGIWTDKDLTKDESVKQSSGLGWFEQFPAKGSTLYTTFHNGCHGCVVFIPRQWVEKAQYFDYLPLKYGFEHSLYCSRILRLAGMNPELFPIMKGSQLFFHGNDKPNNYTVNHEKVFEINGQKHKELLTEVYKGYKLIQPDHRLKKLGKRDVKFN